MSQGSLERINATRVLNDKDGLHPSMMELVEIYSALFRSTWSPPNGTALLTDASKLEHSPLFERGLVPALKAMQLD